MSTHTVVLADDELDCASDLAVGNRADWEFTPTLTSLTTKLVDAFTRMMLAPPKENPRV